MSRIAEIGGDEISQSILVDDACPDQLRIDLVVLDVHPAEPGNGGPVLFEYFDRILVLSGHVATVKDQHH